MADYQIKCITKPDRQSPHERITRAGGVGPTGESWNDSVETIIRFIESKVHRFYTLEGQNKVWVYVRTSINGNKFIQTYSDGAWKNNLLSLYECVYA